MKRILLCPLASPGDAFPLVVIPAGSEQFDLAALVERAGVGIARPAVGLDAARLRTALSAALALDPTPRLALAERFAELNGPEQAAAWIEALPSPGGGLVNV